VQLQRKLELSRKEKVFDLLKFHDPKKVSIYASVYNLLGQANQILSDLHSAKKQKGKRR